MDFYKAYALLRERVEASICSKQIKGEITEDLDSAKQKYDKFFLELVGQKEYGLSAKQIDFLYRLYLSGPSVLTKDFDRSLEEENFMLSNSEHSGIKIWFVSEKFLKLKQEAARYARDYSS